MKKGLYFAQIKADDQANGAVKKVLDQVSGLNKAGLSTELVNFYPVSSGVRKTFIGKALCSSLPFTYVFSKYVYDHKYDGYDFYYFRFEAADYPFRRFLSNLRLNNPDAKIIVEFPDFPNTFWMNTPFHIGLLLKDIAMRRWYKKYIDRFALLDDSYNKIYNVPALHYINGIDIDRIPIRKCVIRDDDSIHIVAVSTMFPVHGYDRILEGMNNYYLKCPKRKVYFHIVGDGPGPELPKYKRIVDEKKLHEYVIFEGRQFGEKLTEIVDSCDIAADVFGGYRKKLEMTSSLKTREYLARGIPIISGCDIDILKNTNFTYVLMFPNDDSPIEIEKIVEFFDSIISQRTREDVCKEMRDFAYASCSTEVAMQEVIEYIVR